METARLKSRAPFVIGRWRLSKKLGELGEISKKCTESCESRKWRMVLKSALLPNNVATRKIHSTTDLGV